MRNKLPKVLIISHNALRPDTNNGKTLSALFQTWDKDRLAQLYFHPEFPNSPLCDNFFQITEMDIIRNLKGEKQCGRAVESQSEEMAPVYKPIKNLTKIKQFYATYFMRDLLWSLNRFKGEELINWLNNFKPDVIFLIMPGVKFSAKIANWISDIYSAPIVLFITDDYYRNYKKTASPVYHLFQKTLRKTLDRTVKRTKHLVTVSKKSSEIYSNLFSLPSTTLYTPAPWRFELNMVDKPCMREVLYFRYFGNLDLNRWKTLIMLGEAINLINKDRVKVILEIYSGTTDKKIIDALTFGSGCKFMGFVSGNDYFEKLKDADVVVHAESFSKYDIKRTELSLSTKIADYLGAGKCILAIGPKQLASMVHLENIAVQAVDEVEIFNSVKEIVDNESLRYKCQKLSLKAASLYHDGNKNCRKLQEIMMSI